MASRKYTSSSLPPLPPPPGFERKLNLHSMNTTTYNSTSFSPIHSHYAPSSSTPTPPPHHIFPPPGFEHQFNRGPNTPTPLPPPPGFERKFNLDSMNTTTNNPTSFSPIHSHYAPSSSTPTPPPHHFFPPSGFEHQLNRGPITLTHEYNHPLSPVVHNFSSHAPTIHKVLNILESHFGPHHVSLSPSSSSSININIDINNSITPTTTNNNNNNMLRMMLMNSYARSYPHDHHARSSSSQPHGPSFQIDNNNNNKKRKKRRNDDDGRIRSLPRDKYGLYQCSKCGVVAATSQKYANHVRHYHPKLQKLNDGASTSAPTPLVAASVDDQSPASAPSVASTFAYDHDHNQITPPLPLSGVKIKSEPINN